MYASPMPSLLGDHVRRRRGCHAAHLTVRQAVRNIPAFSALPPPPPRLRPPLSLVFAWPGLAWPGLAWPGLASPRLAPISQDLENKESAS